MTLKTKQLLSEITKALFEKKQFCLQELRVLEKHI